MDRSPRERRVFTVNFWVAFLWLLCVSTATAYGEGRLEVEIKAPSSIYPCLDTYNLLITKPNLTNENFIRLIRVYTSSSFSLRLKTSFAYIREYKLPPNNLLKFDCHFFSPAYKYYCFVFVARNRKSGAVALTSPPYCKPTTLSLLETHEELYATTPRSYPSGLFSQIKSMQPPGPSLDVRGHGQSGGRRRPGEGNRVSTSLTGENNGWEQPLPTTIRCECNHPQYVTVNESLRVLSVILEMMGCSSNSGAEGSTTAPLPLPLPLPGKSPPRPGSGVSFELIPNTLTSPPGNVCVLNLSQAAFLTEVQLISPLIVTNGLPQGSGPGSSPTFKVRDGQRAIDPLLRVSNRSMAHSLKSRYLRVEVSHDMKLTLRFNFWGYPSKRDKVAWFPSFAEVHYAVLGLAVFVACALLVLVVTGLTATPRKRKVQIGGEEGPLTSESYLGHSSLSQFSFADADSLEMDYYDYLLPFVPGPGRPGSSPALALSD